jgi:hypothetical protein
MLPSGARVNHPSAAPDPIGAKPVREWYKAAMPYRSPSRAGSATLVLTLAILSLFTASASAQTGGYSCEASAVAATVGPAPKQEPITANQGQPACQNASAGGTFPASPLPVTGSLLAATTTLEGPATDPRQQKATAAAGLGELRIAGLPIPLERPDIPAIPPIVLPGVATIDIHTILEGLIPKSANVDLLNVQALRAQVTGQCANGSPQLTGTSSVAGISVLGKALPVDKVVSQSLTLANGGKLDPSNLTLEQLGLPGVTLDPAVQTLLTTALNRIPTITIPATVGKLSVIPGKKIEGGGALTQHALDVSLALAGQNVVDLTIGSATVGSAQVNCGGVADQALQCTSRPIVLIDVLRSGGRVHLLGAANRRFAGKRVRIRFTATGKTVARPKVRNDGLFRATARLPRTRLRNTNKARYVASIRKQKSFRLKLARRMVVTSTTRRGSNVTIAGHITGRLASPPKTVIVQRRLSCGRYKVIKRFKPRRDGRFRITLPGPTGTEAAAYRLRTKVPRLGSKLYPTFTLPRYVDLA